jgi:hypothetical protein
VSFFDRALGSHCAITVTINPYDVWMTPDVIVPVSNTNGLGMQRTHPNAPVKCDNHDRTVVVMSADAAATQFRRDERANVVAAFCRGLCNV